jgi:hypothetical protein
MILVTFAWVFFRANNLNDALFVIKKFFTFDNFFHPMPYLSVEIDTFHIILILLIFSIMLIQFYYMYKNNIKWKDLPFQRNSWIRYSLYLSSIIVPILIGFIVFIIYPIEITDKIYKLQIYLNIILILIVCFSVLIVLIEFDLFNLKIREIGKVISKRIGWLRLKIFALMIFTIIFSIFTLVYENYFNISAIKINVIFYSILLIESIYLINPENVKAIYCLSDKTILLRWPIYYVIIILILLFGVLEKKPFIYFQF